MLYLQTMNYFLQENHYLSEDEVCAFVDTYLVAMTHKFQYEMCTRYVCERERAGGGRHASIVVHFFVSLNILNLSSRMEVKNQTSLLYLSKQRQLVEVISHL